MREPMREAMREAMRKAMRKAMQEAMREAMRKAKRGPVRGAVRKAMRDAMRDAMREAQGIAASCDTGMYLAEGRNLSLSHDSEDDNGEAIRKIYTKHLATQLFYVAKQLYI